VNTITRNSPPTKMIATVATRIAGRRTKTLKRNPSSIPATAPIAKKLANASPPKLALQRYGGVGSVFLRRKLAGAGFFATVAFLTRFAFVKGGLAGGVESLPGVQAADAAPPLPQRHWRGSRHDKLG
jgi:hypothetical protein